MASRIYPWFVLLFWTVMMSWLIGSKVLPPMLGGDPPDYHAYLTASSAKSPPVCWRISWNDRRIGTAMSQVTQRFGGGVSLRQVVHFERMPISAMVSEGLGLLGAAIQPLLGGDSDMELEMQLATELRFDAQRQFQQFQSVVDLGSLPGILQLSGKFNDERKLEVTAQLAGASGGAEGQKIRHAIEVPRNALVADAFTPRTQVTNLHVGQRWTIPVYRPFPPNSQVQIVEAVAERLEVIVWDGRDVETIVVRYREDAGSGLHSSREPILTEWVNGKGVVLQQEVRFSGLKVKFERLTTPVASDETDKLNPVIHPRLWIR
ncbi:MAG: hypothetical protein AB7O38_10705 [Pirellulaceae bacterium]